MSPLESLDITDVAARTHTLEVADQAAKKYWIQIRRVLMERQTDPAVRGEMLNFKSTVSAGEAFMNEARALDNTIPARVTRDDELIAVLTALPAHRETLHREALSLNGDTKRGPVIRDMLVTIDRVRSLLAPLAKRLADPIMREGMEAKEELMELGVHIRKEMLQQHAPAIAEAIGMPAPAKTRKEKPHDLPSPPLPAGTIKTPTRTRTTRGTMVDLSGVPLNPPVGSPTKEAPAEKPLTDKQKTKKNKEVRKQTLLSYREQIALNAVDWVAAIRQGKKAQNALAELLEKDEGLRSVVVLLEQKLRAMLREDGVEPTVPSTHDKEQQVPAPMEDLLKLASKNLRKAQEVQFHQWSHDAAFYDELTYVGVWQKFLETHVSNTTVAELVAQIEAADDALFDLVVEHLVLGRDALKKKKADRFQKQMTDAGVGAILQSLKTYKPERGTFEEHAQPAVSDAVLAAYATLIEAEKQEARDKKERAKVEKKRRTEVARLRAQQIADEALLDDDEDDEEDDEEQKEEGDDDSPVFED